MHSQDISDFSWKTHDYLLGQIKLADTKGGAMVVFCTTILGIMLDNDYQKSLGSFCIYQVEFSATFIGLSFLLLIIGLLFLLFSIWPRFPKEAKHGHISFPQISAWKSSAEYCESLVSSKDLFLEVSEHNFILSKIAMKKFYFISLGFPFTLLGTVSLGVALYFS